MASCLTPLHFLNQPLSFRQEIPSYHFELKNPNPLRRRRRRREARSGGWVVKAAIADSTDQSERTTKLVTFLGKGGSGKTTAAVFAAQHYAMAGLNTCLVIHSQDQTADYLLKCKIGVSPISCSDNLSAVRLLTTNMLLDPLNRLKQADARLNMTQGVLEGVVGEELGVLPGMDSIFSALALERIVGLLGNVAWNDPKDKFDVVVYDGISTEETIRMIGASSKARLYLKYLRNLAEKTDFGRLTGPSLLRLVDEAMSLTGRGSQLSSKPSSEIWDYLDKLLERGSSVLADPSKFGCYLVMNPNNSPSLNCALRYWGCAIQAGVQVSGAFAIATPNSSTQIAETTNLKFSPLPFALLPYLSLDNVPEWNEIMLNGLGKDARRCLSITNDKSNGVSPVKFDSVTKSVTLLMPGFDKSEIKLYQFRGGSELLVEAGDQRRVIRLPSKIQGKVGGAKFIDRTLVVTMR